MSFSHTLTLTHNRTNKVGRPPISVRRAAGLIYGRALGLTLEEISRIAAFSTTTVYNYTKGLPDMRRNQNKDMPRMDRRTGK